MCTTSMGSQNPGQQVADAIADLDAAAARLADLVGSGALSHVPLHALAPLTSTTHRAIARAEAAATVATGAVHRSGVLPEGHVSTMRWLEVSARLSPSEAAGALARARALGFYTATAAGWLSGAVSSGAVRALTLGIDRAAAVLPVCERDARKLTAEATLLELAAVGTVADVNKAVTRLRMITDADGMKQAALDAYDEQSVRVSQVGAGFTITAVVTAEVAAAFLTVLDQQTDQWHRDGTLAELDRVDDGDPASRRRGRIRRRHLHALAFGHLLTQWLGSPSIGSHHGAVPRVTLTADLADLHTGLGGELLLPGREQPVLLTPSSIARFLCDCELSTVVVEGSGCPSPGDLASLLREKARSVLYVGRAHRTVTPRLRRALEARDRHCAFTGCRVSVSRTRAHHVVPWEQGGPTDLDNLVLVCERHHHTVHEGGWIVTATGTDPGLTGYWAFDPPPRPAWP